MGFMSLYTVHMFAYVVETTHGTEIVPAELVGMKAEAGDLAEYVDGKIEDFELKRGWFARYSTAGYLDCTTWCGPYEQREDAIKECRETYGDDEDETTDEEVES